MNSPFSPLPQQTVPACALWAATLLSVALTACDRPWPMDRLDTGVDPVELQAIDPIPAEAIIAPDDTEQTPAPTQAPAVIELTLAQARADALAHNLDLEVALLGPGIAGTGIDEAEAFFESLLFGRGDYASLHTPTSTTLSGSQVKQFSAESGLRAPMRTGGEVSLSLPISRTETNNNFATLDPSYSAEAVAGLRQPLLRGAGLWTNAHRIRIAHGHWQVSMTRTRLEVIRVLAAVDRAYWLLHAVRRELDVRREELALAEAQLRRAQRQAHAGAVAEVQVLRAEAGVAERVEAVILAETLLRRRERDLKRLLNSPDLQLTAATAVIPITDPTVAPAYPNPEQLVEVALERRMEMLELEIRIAQDASTVAFHDNQALPLLALDYRYGLTGLGESWGNAVDMVRRADFQSHRVGLVLEVPMGNRAAASRRRRAMLERIQRLTTRRQMADQIRQEVHDATDSLLAAWQRVVASRRNAALAERVLQAEQQQFDVGLVTSTEVLDAQARLAAARSSEIRAVIDYQIALVDIAYATGTLLGSARVHWEPKR